MSTTSEENTAAEVIEKFGGISACAKLMGLTPSVVQGWKERRIIPAQRQPRLLELARELSIDLDPYDFLPARLRPSKDDAA